MKRDDANPKVCTKNLAGDYHDLGYVTGENNGPFYIIKREDGSRFYWPRDLCELVPDNIKDPLDDHLTAIALAECKEKLDGLFNKIDAEQKIRDAQIRKALLITLWDNYETDRSHAYGVAPRPFPKMHDDEVRDELKRIFGG